MWNARFSAVCQLAGDVKGLVRTPRETVAVFGPHFHGNGLLTALSLSDCYCTSHQQLPLPNWLNQEGAAQS